MNIESTARPGQLKAVMTCFIVDDLSVSLSFYNEKLGFMTDVAVPEADPFFAVIQRDDIAFMLKQIAPDVHPHPNCTRHEWARWDAYIYTPCDQDQLMMVAVCLALW